MYWSCGNYFTTILVVGSDLKGRNFVAESVCNYSKTELYGELRNHMIFKSRCTAIDACRRSNKDYIVR